MKFPALYLAFSNNTLVWYCSLPCIEIEILHWVVSGLLVMGVGATVLYCFSGVWLQQSSYYVKLFLGCPWFGSLRENKFTLFILLLVDVSGCLAWDIWGKKKIQGTYHCVLALVLLSLIGLLSIFQGFLIFMYNGQRFYFLLFYFKIFFLLMWTIKNFFFFRLNFLQHCFCFMFWFLALRHVGSWFLN